MRLWLSKSSEVPLREQLTTQVLLGIFSNDLKPGQKLPSTRELALRFHIHPNTVSAAYRDLVRRGWVESRKGSGVYVKKAPDNVSIDIKVKLDHPISTFFTLHEKKAIRSGRSNRGLSNGWNCNHRITFSQLSPMPSCVGS